MMKVVVKVVLKVSGSCLRGFQDECPLFYRVCVFPNPDQSECPESPFI